jgi:hypothetical protein
MDTAVVLALILLAFAAIHAACAAGALAWRSAPVGEGIHRPSAAVVLSVRGLDPSLSQTVAAVLAQEYEPLRVCIVVDRSNDEAWQVVQEAVRQSGARRFCTVEALHVTRTACGLKSAAIVQAVRGLSDQVEVVATIDADIIPHKGWLATLVRPLADEGTLVATGNHWFEPEAGNCGSLVRSLWNAGALIPTSFFANPWGGSMALRLRDIRQHGLLAAWEKSPVDDGPVKAVCRQLGRRVAFVPSLIMLNRERCSWSFCLRYMARILTWSRLYERSFAWTVAHGLVNGIPFLAAICWAAIAAVRGQPQTSAILCAGLFGHLAFMGIAYWLVRLAVGRMVRGRGEPWSRLTVSRACALFACLPLALAAYGAALCRAGFANSVCWRGIWYYLGTDRVIRLNYDIHRRTTEPNASAESV